MNITLLIGLPGSGKTTYLQAQKGHIFDDMSQIEDGILKLKTIMEKESSKEYKNIFISDVNFCDKHILEVAKVKIASLIEDKINFQYIVFDADGETAQNNVIYRNDGRYVTPTIKRFSKHLPALIEHIKSQYNELDYQIIKTPKMNNIKNNKII